MTDESKLVNATQLASILGVSNVDITNYVREGMPRITGINQKAHRFDLEECTRWYYELRNKQHTIRQASLREAQIRKLNLESDRIELELAERRKEVIEISKISAIWGGLLVAFKTRMMAIPKRLSTLYDSIEDAYGLESVSSTLINDALEELSQQENLITRAVEDN